jgi:hypothetical protein
VEPAEMAVAREGLCKQMDIAIQWHDKHVSMTDDVRQQWRNCWEECFLLGPRRGYIRRACRQTVSESEVLVRQSPPGGGMGGRGVLIVESCCIATSSEGAKDITCAIVNCKVCELVKWLQLLVVKFVRVQQIQ